MVRNTPTGVFVRILTSWTGANRPQPFKIYPKLERIPLPRDVSQTGVAALSAISDALSSSRDDSVPDLQDLARILYFSAGITKQRRSPGGESTFAPQPVLEPSTRSSCIS